MTQPTDMTTILLIPASLCAAPVSSSMLRLAASLGGEAARTSPATPTASSPAA